MRILKEYCFKKQISLNLMTLVYTIMIANNTSQSYL